MKLRLSTLSFRLQPRQAYTVFYEADADTVPYWFNVWSGITGSKTESGINLRIELPHVVYLYQKLKLAQADIAIRSIRYRPADHQIIVEFANSSPRLGRVQSVLASAEKVKSQEAAGFPLFPNSVRRMRMPWADSLPPQKIEVRFDGFRLTSTDIAIDTSAVPVASPIPAARRSVIPAPLASAARALAALLVVVSGGSDPVGGTDGGRGAGRRHVAVRQLWRLGALLHLPVHRLARRRLPGWLQARRRHPDILPPGFAPHRLERPAREVRHRPLQHRRERPDPGRPLHLGPEAHHRHGGGRARRPHPMDRSSSRPTSSTIPSAP